MIIICGLWQRFEKLIALDSELNFMRSSSAFSKTLQ